MDLPTLAATQAGRVSTPQLHALGLGERDIGRILRDGWLHRLADGVHAVGHPGATPDGDRWAALLAVGPGSVLIGASAGSVWNVASEPAAPEVACLRGSGAQRGDGIVVRRLSLADADVTTLRGMPLTTLSRTLLDLAATRGTWAARHAFEQAQVEHRLRVAEVLRELDRWAGQRGAARLREVVEGVEDPGLVRSRSEVSVFALCTRYDLPRPRVDVRMGRWTVDFWWPGARLVLEADSRRYHGTVAAQRRDPVKQAWLEAQGIVVERTTWTEVTRRPRAVVARLRTHLEA